MTDANGNWVGKKKTAGGVILMLGRCKTTNSYGVWKLKENYDGRVRGGISKRWAYIEKGLEYDAAKQLFERKLKSKAKH